MPVTSPPTSTPVASPTSAPTPPVSCANDPDFKLGGKKNCLWMMLTKKRRKKFCKKGKVREKCPVTCGACCADSETFEFKVKIKKVERTKKCAWLEKQKKNKVNKYCKGKVETGCTKTCKFCPF